MQILEDQQFIECLDKMSGPGNEITLGGEFKWNSRRPRLNAAGREFVDAINRPEIRDVLKVEFADASLSTPRSAAKILLPALLEKQFG